jgi:queuine tRNA-ribosyltransferase
MKIDAITRTKGNHMLGGFNWVPVLTSDAGLCLTPENWQEANIDIAAYYLDSLLFKPGLAVLNTISNLSSYVNWSGTIIINASRFKANHEGIITLISPYDGSKIKLDYSQLIDLMVNLKPKAVILPEEILKEYPQIWERWDKNILPYLSGNHIIEDKLPLTYGVYFASDNNPLKMKEQFEKYQHVPQYVQGALNVELINEYCQLGVQYFESNEPNQLGFDGLVYSEDGIIDLKEKQYALQFTMINSQCKCSTCSAQLTKAYLHHLFLHTPLLCQRFLIQHNGHYVQNFLRK